MAIDVLTDPATTASLATDLNAQLGIVLAAPLGALCALLWYRGEAKRKTSMFGVGWLISYYSAETLAAWAGMSVGFVAFLLGLFGIAVIDKVFKTWGELDIGQILSHFLHKMLGLGERRVEHSSVRQNEHYETPDFPELPPRPPRSFQEDRHG